MSALATNSNPRKTYPTLNQPHLIYSKQHIRAQKCPSGIPASRSNARSLAFDSHSNNSNRKTSKRNANIYTGFYLKRQWSSILYQKKNKDSHFSQHIDIFAPQNFAPLKNTFKVGYAKRSLPPSAHHDPQTKHTKPNIHAQI